MVQFSSNHATANNLFAGCFDLKVSVNCYSPTKTLGSKHSADKLITFAWLHCYEALPHYGRCLTSRMPTSPYICIYVHGWSWWPDERREMRYRRAYCNSCHKLYANACSIHSGFPSSWISEGGSETLLVHTIELPLDINVVTTSNRTAIATHILELDASWHNKRREEVKTRDWAAPGQ